jgi:hypothetical protein
MDVEPHFKPAGQGVRLLVMHSTQNCLGKKTAKRLIKSLSPDAIIVGVERAADFREFVNIVGSADPFNILLVIAHGDKRDHKFWLHADQDVHGNELGVNVGELKAALEGKADDILALFGVCYFGTEDIADAVVNQAGALACVAPIATETITSGQIITGYGNLINAIHGAKDKPIGPYELTELVRASVPEAMYKILSIKPDL